MMRFFVIELAENEVRNIGKNTTVYTLSIYLVLIMKTFWLPNLSFKTFCATVEVLFLDGLQIYLCDILYNIHICHCSFLNKTLLFLYKKKRDKRRIIFGRILISQFLILAESDQSYRTTLICISALCSAVILTF